MKRSPTISATAGRALAALACVFGLALASGCETEQRTGGHEQPAPPPGTSVEDLEATLQLKVHQETAELVDIDLLYSPRTDAERPRAAEIWLRASAALEFSSGAALDATLAAGKMLVTQPDADGVVRIVLFSTTSLERLGAGGLARLQFKVVGEGERSVELLDRRPVFAPAEADQGLILPSPLTVRGGSTSGGM